MSATIYTTPKLKIETNGRHEMETMHLMDTQADEEKALCGVNVPADDLTGVDDYVERRKDGLPVGTVCEPCKAPAVRWVESRRLKLEADAGELRAGADRLERMATNSLANAKSCLRQSEEPARCRSSAERRNMEAAQLEDEADECRRVADMLARETGLTRRRAYEDWDAHPCVGASCVFRRTGGRFRSPRHRQQRSRPHFSLAP